MFRYAALAILPLVAETCVAEVRPPRVVGVFPLSGRAGTTVELEISGDRLANAAQVEFDCRDLVWTTPIHANWGKLKGSVAIQPNASLGPHLLHVVSPDGNSTSALFNVTGFATVAELEPNDHPEKAQRIQELPVEIQGRLSGAPDIDRFSFSVNAGERWLFDLRAIEHGSAVEARMILFDPAGRQIEFNDDRGDFDENPLIDYTFREAGTYTLMLDQYRGPRGFNFGKNNAYSLRISQLPLIQSVSPLGASRGKRTRFRVEGHRMDRVDKIYLTEARLAEISRMTYPFTIPIRFLPDPPNAAGVARIEGLIHSKQKGAV
jgi:hypothetical protein